MTKEEPHVHGMPVTAPSASREPQRRGDDKITPIATLLRAWAHNEGTKRETDANPGPNQYLIDLLLDAADEHDAVLALSSSTTSALADELERLGARATEAPWAWDQRGEKVNEWGLGVAFDKNEKPLSGHFDDEDAIYIQHVCSTEGSVLNGADPALICALRNNLPEIVAALRARPSTGRASIPLSLQPGPEMFALASKLNDTTPAHWTSSEKRALLGFLQLHIGYHTVSNGAMPSASVAREEKP